MSDCKTELIARLHPASDALRPDKPVTKKNYSYQMKMSPSINLTFNRRQLLDEVNDDNLSGDRFE